MSYEPYSEEMLLGAWRAGDRGAADELLRRCTPLLQSFFRQRTSQNVDELVQRTLVACLQAVDQFEGRATFRSFLLGIARNQFLMSLRSNRPSEQPNLLTTFPEDSPSQLVASKEELRILVEALNTTPSPFREALRMFYWDELSVEEIARVLAISSGTVKSRLARGRAMIRERIMAAARSRQDIVRKLLDWMSPGNS